MGRVYVLCNTEIFVCMYAVFYVILYSYSYTSRLFFLIIGDTASIFGVQYVSVSGAAYCRVHER